MLYSTVISKRNTELTLKNLYGYHDILLRIYFEIASDGDVSRLIKQGVCSRQVCEDAWEKIVRKNNEETGNYNYLNYLETLKTYEYLLQTFHKVKTCLFKLSIRCDYAVIEMLAVEGYTISKIVSQYDKTLYAAGRKSDNLLTKIKSKRKELEFYSRHEGQETNFEQALANVSFSVKYNVDRNISLSGYNELRKLIKKNHGSGNRSR